MQPPSWLTNSGVTTDLLSSGAASASGFAALANAADGKWGWSDTGSTIGSAIGTTIGGPVGGLLALLLGLLAVSSSVIPWKAVELYLTWLTLGLVMSGTLLATL
jgi:hypothetical protein